MHLIFSSLILGESILDSGGSHHISSSKGHFSSLEQSKVPHIFVGNDTQMEVEGKGQVEMEDEEFKDVLYVPNLSTNLLSIYQITHCGGGNKVEFLPDSVVVQKLKDDSLFALGKINHATRLYSFSHLVPKSPSHALLTHSQSQNKLWHERYGHLSFHYLHQLISKNMVKGLPKINFYKGECSTCSMDMHLEEKFDKGKSWRALVVLELVHTILVGPFSVTSVRKGRYVLTFIDDFSRYTWVYFLDHKNEEFNKFLAFKSHVEKQSSKAIKVLHMDNESRYVNSRLRDFCELEGIDL
jgi:hypothetical protein